MRTSALFIACFGLVLPAMAAPQVFTYAPYHHKLILIIRDGETIDGENKLPNLLKSCQLPFLL